MVAHPPSRLRGGGARRDSQVSTVRGAGQVSTGGAGLSGAQVSQGMIRRASVSAVHFGVVAHDARN